MRNECGSTHSIDKAMFDELFLNVFQANGLEKYVTDASMAAFQKLTERMLTINAVMNLTALTTIEKIIPLHYADCALIADRFPLGASVADVGCGGGFPTLPVAILRPDLHITAIDSTEKKIRYVNETAHFLELSNVCGVAARAEELGRDPRKRESFDVVVSRAVARMNILDELCLPLCRIGGTVLLLKGSAGRDEQNEAAAGIQRLGGEKPTLEMYALDTTDDLETRTLTIVKKCRATPPEFPRTFGQIRKRPL